MMDRLEELKDEVVNLYSQKLEGRDEWADWLSTNHVPVVASYTKELAPRYNANSELAQAAAWLHDIADYKISRDNPRHEEMSMVIARQLLKKHGYSEDEVKTVVDDAIRFHSCKDGQRPESNEGLVLAAADSLAHLKTSFYDYAFEAMDKYQPYEKTRAWVLAKLERDLNDKITFDDLRNEARPYYLAIKQKYSN